MTPKKWQLLSKKDVSPDKWLPIETRTYKHPNGSVIDFSVTTLADVSMIVPVTKDKKVILVNQFKPGAGDVLLEFPAGRIEKHHKDFVELAQKELEEEVGIKVERENLTHFATLGGFVSKGAEKVYFYFAPNLEFNSEQCLDKTEDIEIVTLSFKEMDEYIYTGKIWAAQTIAGWELAKKHFPKTFIINMQEL